MTDNTFDIESLGPFKTGETPAPLRVRFDDSNGDQLDISSGYAVKAFYRTRTGNQASATEITGCTIDTSTNALGYAKVPIPAAAVADPGAYFIETWVGDGTTKLASRTFSYYVETSVAPAPSFP